MTTRWESHDEYHRWEDDHPLLVLEEAERRRAYRVDWAVVFFYTAAITVPWIALGLLAWWLS